MYVSQFSLSFVIAWKQLPKDGGDVRTSCPKGMRTENFSLITDYFLSNCLTDGCNQLPDMDSTHVSLCLHLFSCFALCTLVYIPTLTDSGNVSGSSSYSIRIATRGTLCGTFGQ